MALVNNTHSIIVPATSPNFSAHSYTHVYAGVDAAPVINGVSVIMPAGTILDLKVNTISNAAGCYLLGEKADVILGSINL